GPPPAPNRALPSWNGAADRCKDHASGLLGAWPTPPSRRKPNDQQSKRRYAREGTAMKREEDSAQQTRQRGGTDARTRAMTGWSATLGVALLAVAGCGGTTTFQDTTPIRIAVAPDPPKIAADPPPEPPRVELKKDRIEIHEKIQFALDKSEILPASFGLLDEITKVIQENPHVQKISIEGHASDEGDGNYNLRLSQARAEAVRAYLVSKGV